MKTSLKASLIAAAIASLPFGVHAAGLGQINILSGLGQPLKAEIQLNASAHELESLSARIPSPEAFRQANVPYSPVMSGLKVAVESRGNRPVLKISSDRPVNEPFVDLLVELNWAAGRLIREYTVLLDPVELRNSASNAAPAVTAPAATPSAAVAPAPAARSSATAGSSKGDSYTVQRGDTLRRIAETHRPADASLDQMLVALFRENRDAFDGDNMNRLRAGTVLSIPQAAKVEAVGAAEAHKEILAQAADFNAYRRRLAGTVAEQNASAAEAEAPSQASSGRIVPKVADAVPAEGNGDQVRVSRSTEAAVAGGRGDRLRALEEELAARDRALTEANDRVAALEHNIHELQQLIELKNQNLAQLQQQAGGAPATGAAPEPAKSESAPAAEAAGTDTAKPVQRAPAAAPAPKQPKPAAAPAPAPAPVAEPGFLGTLLQDPTVLAGGGGILVLLLAYAGYKARQRRKAQAEADHAAAASGQLPPETNSVFGATGGQSVDTANSSVLQTDFSQAGLSAIDADEGVDPVAEADVYMAYGRDAQAEEILLDALKVDPTRLAIHLKLLEIYSQRKNTKQFEAIASELYSRTEGRGAEWDKAAAMGRKLDPENPLYHSTGEATEPVTEPPRDLASGAAAMAAAAAVATVAEAVADEPAPAAPLADLDFTTKTADDTAEAGLKETWAMPRDLAGGDAAEPEKDEVATGMDAATLDFDLDLDVSDAGSGDAQPLELDELAASAASEPVAAAAAGGDLMFDLELDQGSDGATPGAEAPSTEAGDEDLRPLAATAIDPDFGPAEDKDLDLDFDLSGPEGAPTAGEDSTESFDLVATMAGTDGMLDAAQAAEDERPGAFDNTLLDFDLDLEGLSAAPTEAAEAMDLSSIDLDLQPLPAAQAAQAEAAGDAGPGASTAVREEVDTKLELARAYEEMGDKEGARELLEEVLQEGNAEQQGAARSLIARLA